MIKWTYLLLLNGLIFLSLSVKAQSKFITVKGKDIIGTDGKPFLMKGTNLGNWLVPEGYMLKLSKANSPGLINKAITEIIGPDAARDFWKKFLDNYVTKDDIRYLKSTGMNSIRIPFSYKLFTYGDYLGDNNPGRGFELLDRVIGWCRQEGLYVILDMHCAPGGQTGDNIDDGYGYPFLFLNAGSKQQTIQIWKKIASHYRNEITILGYDLLNEPIAIDEDILNDLLVPFYKELVQAIRTVDKNHLMILGGAQWDSKLMMLGKPFDGKTIYTFHKYYTPPKQEAIQEYLDYREKYNVPIYCGESGENKDEWVAEFRMLLDKNNIGWHYWPYKKMDNASGIMSFNPPADYDKFIAYTEKPRESFADVRKAAPTREDREKIKQAIFAVLDNCKFQNCLPNNGYIEALGLSPGK